MKVPVDRIRPEGLQVQEDADPQKLDLNTEVACFRAPLKIEARLERISDVVNASLNVRGTLVLVCCRCLSEFNIELDQGFTVDYQVEKGMRLIDLDPDIRDHIMLEYPLKPLCSEACKGLCPRCGANLNIVAKCDCD